MARRMEGKDRDELALDDKLDVANTLLTLGSRIELRHKKNEVTTKIRQNHQKEVNRGAVTSPIVPGADQILESLGYTAELEAGQPGDAASSD